MEEILLFILLCVIFILYIAYLFYSALKCRKKGLHDYVLFKEKFVKGEDIGFGITNSLTMEWYKCSKCGDIHETYR